MCLNLDAFFREKGIDVFCEVGLDDLQDDDRSSVLEFLPSARSVIVFGMEVPLAVYRMPAKDKTREMLRIATAIDNTAVLLAGLLEEEHVPARPVPLYLPVRIVNGKVLGVVRLKQLAAAGGLGSIGKNTVLLTQRFGPRLFLLGVVTARPVQEDRQAGRDDVPLCSGCGRCIKVCPTGALGPDGVDAFRCRTVSAWVPSRLVPAVKWMLRRKWLLRCTTPLAPWVARTATIRCSLCVTECPVVEGEGEPGFPG
jgi:epoxyqueuosine reductase QueG